MFTNLPSTRKSLKISKKKNQSKKNAKEKEKENACQLQEAWSFSWYCQMLSSFPVLPTKSFLKSILHSNENGNGMKFQFWFAWNTRPPPASSPVDQRRSAGTTFSDSESVDGFFSWRCLIQQRPLEVHSFSAVMGCRKRRFSFRFQKALSSWELAHIWRKTPSCLCDSSCSSIEPLVLLYSRTHLEFCPKRKRFCLLAYFPWRALYLHYVR